tara:strand:- start:645 stop:851 length:207 start_codon:yes stop_codon:yes gene_type:complete
MPEIPALFTARYHLRRAYYEIKKMADQDEMLPEICDQLDAMCSEITTTIDADQMDMFRSPSGVREVWR